jgi:hypothetical protein
VCFSATMPLAIDDSVQSRCSKPFKSTCPHGLASRCLRTKRCATYLDWRFGIFDIQELRYDNAPIAPRAFWVVLALSRSANCWAAKGGAAAVATQRLQDQAVIARLNRRIHVFVSSSASDTHQHAFEFCSGVHLSVEFSTKLSYPLTQQNCSQGAPILLCGIAIATSAI